MNGLDQVIIALWCLPVVLFIIVPLIIGFVWMPISFFVEFIQRRAEHERQFQSVVAGAGSTT